LAQVWPTGGIEGYARPTTTLPSRISAAAIAAAFVLDDPRRGAAVDRTSCRVSSGLSRLPFIHPTARILYASSRAGGFLRRKLS